MFRAGPDVRAGAVVRVELGLDVAVEQRDDHFAGSADDRAVQVAAENMAALIAGRYMQMRIVRAVLGRDRPVQGDDLQITGEGVFGIALLFDTVDANGHLADRAERVDMRQPDLLCTGDFFELIHDLLAPVDAGEDGRVKFPIIHRITGAPSCRTRRGRPCPHSRARQ